MRSVEYDIQLTVNGIKINKVIIDPHYESKHSKSINDQIILRLVKKLDGQYFEPEDTEIPYSYFVTEGMLLEGKQYRLVWLLEKNKLYIGVINAYRR